MSYIHTGPFVDVSLSSFTDMLMLANQREETTGIKDCWHAHMGTGKTDSRSRQVYESENILDAFALLHSLVQ